MSGLTAVLVLMFVAGAAQNAVVALDAGFGFATLADDLLLLLAVLLVAPRLSATFARATLVLGVYIVLMLVASARSTVDTGVTFDLLRAAVVPGLLLIVGMALRLQEWRFLIKAWILVSFPTVIYMIVEGFGIRLVEPADYIQNAGIQTFLFGNYGNLPGAYLVWATDGSVSERAGGLFMNPPVAGLAVAVSAVMVAYTVRGVIRFPLLALHLAALWLSQGRGGLVVVILALIMPFVARRIGKTMTALLALPVAFLLFRWFSATGDSISHFVGLTDGLRTVGEQPLGEGFGTAGNAVKLALRSEESSESLLGFILIAAGLPAFIVFALLAVALVRRVWRTPGDWVGYLGVAAFATAAVAESAGALAGASMLWIGAGVALAHRDRQSHQDTPADGATS